MGVDNASLTCVKDKLTPPGDCKPSQHRWLQDQVNKNCKEGERSCEQNQDCATLFKNLSKNFKCGDARREVNNTCFRGGDDKHIQAFLDAVGAAAKCQRIIDQKCRKKPEPVPQPVPTPVADKSFMEKMAAITGLTGSALIIYIIVSEGSRLFPPRNLVPIP